jgi:hypothetical protein
MRSSLVPVLVLAACGPATGPEFDFGPECGEAEPTLGELVLTDLGTRTIGGEERRAISLTAEAADEDGGLHAYVAKVWYDTFEDGELPSLPSVEVDATVGEVACGVTEANVGVVLPLGGNVPFGTRVEFGMVVEDVDGFESNGGEPVFGVFSTPADEAPTDTDAAG